MFKKEGDDIVNDLILLSLLGVGAFFDAREHRIPNWWVMLGAGAGFLLSILETGSVYGSFLFLLRFAAVTVVFFVLFLCRMIGAGDIKMAALICGYLGFSTGAVAIGGGFFIGAVWSLLKMIKKGSLFVRFAYLFAYIRRVVQTGKLTEYYSSKRDGYDMVIPLGLCLFLGTFLSVLFL